MRRPAWFSLPFGYPAPTSTTLPGRMERRARAQEGISGSKSINAIRFRAENQDRDIPTGHILLTSSGLGAKKNGELLSLMEGRWDVLLTNDRNIQYHPVSHSWPRGCD